MTTPLMDLDNADLRDVAKHGDCMDDPAWLALFEPDGDESVKAAAPVFAHGKHDQSTHGRKGPKARVPSGSRPSAPAVPKAPANTAAPAKKAEPEPAKKASPAKKFKKSVRDGIAGNKWRDGLDEETEASIREVFSGDFAGMTTSGVEVSTDGAHGLLVTGNIIGPKGQYAGEFEWKYTTDESGKLVAHNELLSLQPEIHGQGFAQAFNGRLFDWYRESGVAEVQLTANIDVGGYAWASAGYDWGNSAGPIKVRSRIRARITAGDDRIPADRMEEQLRLAEEMSDRMRNTELGSPDYPTPFEVSQLGRWPGAGRDDWWIGKAAMMGSDWVGVTVP